LSLFLNATVADRRTGLMDAQVAGGLVYTGLSRSRPDDDIGFAVGMTHVNSRVAWSETSHNLAGLGPVPVRNSEYVVEATTNTTRLADWRFVRTFNMLSIRAGRAKTGAPSYSA